MSGRRRYDQKVLSSSAGWKYQVSHWAGWVAAIAQIIADAFK